LTSETFADLAPQREIDALYKLRDRVLGYLDAPVNVRPYRLAVSPNQQQIAIAVEYNIIVTQVWERVGFTEVWIIDNQGHIKQSALKIGLHSDEFIPYPTITSFRDVYVREIEWLPSQEAVSFLISLLFLWRKRPPPFSLEILMPIVYRLIVDPYLELQILAL
jgi:hypothetical protein